MYTPCIYSFSRFMIDHWSLTPSDDRSWKFSQFRPSSSSFRPLVSMFSKHKRHMRKQTVGNCFEFFYFILLKETFQRKWVKIYFKKCERDKSFISFIYFLYALLALRMILSRHVTSILHCSLLDTVHGRAIVNFNGFFSCCYCIFVMS